MRRIGRWQPVALASVGAFPDHFAAGRGRGRRPRAIVKLWMNSPRHRADILRPAFTEIGIGVALGAPQIPHGERASAATYTTDFGGVVDASLPDG